MDHGVTIEEARWLNEESARHTDEETPREEALDHCRILLGRYGGVDELASLTVVDAGPCMDGADPHDRHEANVRYQVGRFTVCRDHAMTRLRARARLDMPIEDASPIADERPPDDLHAWAKAVAAGYTEIAVRAALRVWQTDDDTICELVDLYADTRAEIRARQQAEEILLQSLDQLQQQRCDLCRRRAPLVYLVGDDAFCRNCAITTFEVDKQEVAR